MASENNFVQAAIPRFDGHYDHWSMLMENFIRSKEYWPIVEDGIKAPAVGKTLTDAQKTEFEARKLKDLKAKNYLFQAIERPILETILCKETSKDIWDSMKKKYQCSTIVKRAQLQALRRDFETLQMKEGEFVTNYCARTMEIYNKMRFHGENMGDVVIVEKILRSLTRKYDYVVCSIEESKDIDVLSLDELQSSLLVGTGRGRGRGRRRGDHGGRDSCRNFKANNDQSQGKGRGRDYDKSKIECYRCHKFGHYASECYTRLPNDKEKEEKSNYAENKEGFRCKVSFGDCSTVDATGKGDIKIKTKNGFVETISNVLYVPDLKSNLLSVGQLQEKVYVIIIKKGECEIYDPVRGAIAIVQMSSNRLFPIKIDNIQSCLMTEVKDPSWLWHFCYGHLSFGGLKTL
ncbi:PREDICTED: uncharacterized protein LOC109235854 [Nicotiana attenuata]|uniref:uncharacterized protein LOC109235854 n=1 Tax=Nicotiana attenuata TaxID=49451 RepID=UPI0009051E93|nr:PREDICTED: uncharacterized protein LOC109235854 [Nicotiana attenuata]